MKHPVILLILSFVFALNVSDATGQPAGGSASKSWHFCGQVLSPETTSLACSKKWVVDLSHLAKLQHFETI